MPCKTSNTLRLLQEAIFSVLLCPKERGLFKNDPERRNKRNAIQFVHTQSVCWPNRFSRFGLGPGWSRGAFGGRSEQGECGGSAKTRLRRQACDGRRVHHSSNRSQRSDLYRR